MGTRMSEWPLVTIRSSLGCFTCQLGRIQPIYIRGYYNLLILSTSSIVTWIKFHPEITVEFWAPPTYLTGDFGLTLCHQLRAAESPPSNGVGFSSPRMMPAGSNRGKYESILVCDSGAETMWQFGCWCLHPGWWGTYDPRGNLYFFYCAEMSNTSKFSPQVF